MRIKRSVTARRRHKKILKMTKGMGHTRRASYRKAHEAVLKSLSYAYRDRRNKKRDFRSLWIARINAAARQEDTTYSKLIADLQKSNILLNRKMLAEIAAQHPQAFSAVVRATASSKEKLPSK